jgi:hypothetical protein
MEFGTMLDDDYLDDDLYTDEDFLSVLDDDLDWDIDDRELADLEEWELELIADDIDWDIDYLNDEV